jgi:hypothetical protein
VGVRPGLQRDPQGRVQLVHRSIRHQRDIRRDIVASRGDPLLLHPDDRRLSSGHLIEDHSTSSSVARSSNSLGLFSRTDQGFRLVGSHLLLRAPGLLGSKKGCWTCGEPHYQRDCPVERTRVSGSVRTHYRGRYGQGPSDSCSGE